jgi:hypothetical protein
MPFLNLVRYEDFQALGRELTKQIALAESRKEWQEVDDLLREKDGINQWLKDLKDQDQ